MLTHLQVRDFAIVDQISVDFAPGMTVLTGETGAGKSILVDAVGLVLGDRGNSQMVRHGAERAEFSAQFDITELPAVREWLEEQALEQDNTCLLRRSISADGRSRAFINGSAATIQQLKDLGEMLLDIHGQHFHQSLVRRPVQRDLLDHYGGLLELRAATAAAFAEWQSLEERLKHLLSADAERASRLDLLTFQLRELEALDAKAGEIDDLQSQRQRLKHSGALADGITAALRYLAEEESGNTVALLAEAGRSVEALVGYDMELAAAVELIESAGIQVAEACDLLQRLAERIDVDPARRDWIEERLDAFHTLARKHRVTPAELSELAGKLAAERDELDNAEERGKALQKQAAASEARYRELAASLSTRRKSSAAAFSAAVTGAMQGLGMAGGQFDIAVTARPDEEARSWGIDNIEFRISANPGQPAMPLSRVASGGELSRMSLAIQVIASDGSTIPTMVFDEVDSGVGGSVAEMVGRRLRELGGHRQVLCVTHLPQVASLADQHIRISKVSDGKVTRTGVKELSRDERIEELARMLGGVQITRKTIEHAAEMLTDAGRRRA